MKIEIQLLDPEMELPSYAKPEITQFDIVD